MSFRVCESCYFRPRSLSQSRTVLRCLFFCARGVAIPGSLFNMFKEIHDDLGKPIPASGNLDRWVRQGVFPLNSVLTVRAYETGSHRNMGWEVFTDAVIRKLSDERENLVFMLWGSYAFNLSIKRLPFPNSLSTERVPPCASTKSLDIDNPNPLPCTFVPGTRK